MGGFGRAVRLFGLAGVLASVGLLGLVSDGSAATTVWGNAVEVPGIAALLASLNGGGTAYLNSVSCSAAGTCAAVGNYTDGIVRKPFVVAETNGVWGNAIEAPGSEALNHGQADLLSVSCGAPGTCAAVGYYTDGAGGLQAMVIDETNGVWGNAIEAPGSGTLNTGGAVGESDLLQSVSCAAPGTCAAGGYLPHGSGYQAFVIDETNGVWGNAIEVPGIEALNTGGYAEVRSISCAAAGNCTAVGSYSDGPQSAQAFVVDETNGVWDTAIEAPGSAALNSAGNGGLQAVACAGPGNCAAGGWYEDQPGSSQVFVVDETNGVWGDAIEVPGSATLNHGYANVMSISCATFGNCSAGGFYRDGSGQHWPFVVDETNGSWGDAIRVPGASVSYNVGGEFSVFSVSCPTAGNCVAAGGAPSFVVSETNGAWNDAVQLTGPNGAVEGGEVSSVSCGAVGSCTAGGLVISSSGNQQHASSGSQQAFIATSQPLTPLRAGTTICNGTYGGTGRSIVVPSGDRCTLVPGTHVTSSVTVSHGGTLHISRVTIGGTLTLSGSATVCSSVGGAIVATGGSLALGGPNCAGNKISGNVLVRFDPKNITIRGNKISGNLTVNHGTGPLDSIAGNTISSNLLVEYSGPPVAVSHNHAYTARCVTNKGQTGSGNVAKGKNTCPH